MARFYLSSKYYLLAYSTASLVLASALTGCFNGEMVWEPLPETADVAEPVRESATFSFEIVSSVSSSVTAGAPFSLTLMVKDQYGNLAADYSGTVYLTSVDLQFTTSSYTFGAADIGLHTFESLNLRTAGEQTIFFTNEIGAALASSTVTVLPDEAHARLMAVREPAGEGLEAGQDFSTQPKYGIFDLYGNAVAASAKTVTVNAFSNSTCTAAVNTASGILRNVNATTNTQGIADYASLNFSKSLSGALYIQASSSGFVSSSCSPAITITTVGVVSSLVFTQAPSGTQNAGGVFSPHPQVLAKNSSDSVVSGQTITLEAYPNSASCAAGDKNNSPLAGTGTAVTDSNGIATFSTVKYNLATGALYFKASLGNINSPCVGPIEIEPDVNSLAFTVSNIPTSVTAGTDFNVNFILKDSYANALSGEAVSLALHRNSDSTVVSDANFSSASEDSGSDGTVGFTRQVRTAGTYFVRATLTSNGTVTQDSSAFTIQPASIHHLSFSSQPSGSNVTAGSEFSSAGTPVKVQVQDEFDNVIQSGTSGTATVTLNAFTDSGCGAGATGSLRNATGPANIAAISGEGTFTQLNYTKAPETIYLQASTTLGGVTYTSSCSTGSVVVVSGAATQSQAAFSGILSTAEIGSPLSSSLKVTVRDAYSNPVPSTSVVLSFHNAASCGGYSPPSYSVSGTTSTTTDASGFATFANVTPNSTEPSLMLGATIGSSPNQFTICSNQTINVREPWWNPDWTKRRKITINNSNSNEAFSQFPVLVRLSLGAFDYSRTKNAGDDLRFYSVTNATVLDHEIEKWDDSGESLIWVRLPSVAAASTNEQFWMYYGNVNASAIAPTPSLWNQFLAILHFSTAPGDGGYFNDSAGSNSGQWHPGTSGQTQDSGVVAGSIKVEPDPSPTQSGSSVQIANTGAFAINPNGTNGAFTYEAWIKPTAINTWNSIQTLLSKWKFGADSSTNSLDASHFAMYDAGRAYSSPTPNSGGIDVNAKGYFGGIFDGRYIYYTPDAGNPFILQYDTQNSLTFSASTSAWAKFNTGTAFSGTTGFRGGAFDGTYVYFAPAEGAASAMHGTVLRYNTTGSGGFTNTGNWESFTLTDSANTSLTNRASLKGFEGAVFDGRYIYFVPYYLTSSTVHGNVVRYDTQQTFTTAASWSVYDLTASGNMNSTTCAACMGYSGAVFDGQYIYFIPANYNSPHGNFVRFDTKAGFLSNSSWNLYNIASGTACSGPSPTVPCTTLKGYSGGTFDGRYIYFAPLNGASNSYHGRLLRLDTQGTFTNNTTNSWKAYDLAYSGGTANSGNAPNIDLKGFSGASFDGRYIYFTPYNNGAYSGKLLRFDTTKDFTTGGSYVFQNFAQTSSYLNDTGAKGYVGSVYDGRFLYLIPNTTGTLHGKFVRYDTLAGSLPGQGTYQFHYNFPLAQSGFGGGPGVYRFLLNTDAGPLSLSAPNPHPTAAAWEHLAVTGQTTPAGFTSLRLYKNGTELSSILSVSAMPTGSALANVYIGASGADAATPSVLGKGIFSGNIDEFRISNTARSPDWLSQQYRSMNPLSAPALLSIGTESSY